jgi:hypothetical protein
MNKLNHRPAALCLCLALLLTLLPAPKAQAATTNSNTTKAKAIQVTDGETVTLPAGGDSWQDYYYVIQTNQARQFIQWSISDSSPRAWVNDSAGNTLDCYSETAVTQEAGRYYIEVRIYSGDAASTMTVTLLDNDANEPNNTAETAAPLTEGQSADFIVGGGDTDYFSIQTTRPGQDIAVKVSGFSYAVQGRVDLAVDGANHCTVSSNGTYYYHAAQAGSHTICFSDGRNTGDSGALLPLAVTATVLDGDENELNDTKETATPLLPDTDEFFSVGGWGDEDWFTFEAELDPGESQKLYTLNFLDLNTDYSDQFYYDVYAPDGSTVVSGTKVNIRHSNILACDQQGLYAVRVYAIGKNKWGGDEYCDISRSTLRIRVDEGGADPYENNDTWLTASPIQTDQPINFVLSNTTDQDWFSFSVPEADMTLTLTLDSTLNWKLYSGEELQEYGVEDYNNNALAYQFSYSSGVVYYRFTDPGTYYLCLSAGTSYVSEDLRTMTLSLDTPKDVENNDYWKNATPIYEGVPQSYDLTAYNDVDWFKIEVPEGTGSLMIQAGSYMWL